MNPQFTIRPAQPEETGLVLEFIKKLAVYEKCADDGVDLSRLEPVRADGLPQHRSHTNG